MYNYGTHNENNIKKTKYNLNERRNGILYINESPEYISIHDEINAHLSNKKNQGFCKYLYSLFCIK